jgi:hypothetical protein
MRGNNMGVEFRSDKPLNRDGQAAVVALVVKTPGMTMQWYIEKLKSPITREDWLRNTFCQAVRRNQIVGFHKPDVGRVFYYPPGTKPAWCG